MNVTPPLTVRATCFPSSLHTFLSQSMLARASGATGQCLGQGSDLAGTSRAVSRTEFPDSRLGGESGCSLQGKAEPALLCAVVVWSASGIPDPALEGACLK